MDLTDDEKKAAEQIFTKEKNVAEMQRGWNSVSEGSRLAQEALEAKKEADRVKLEAETAAAKNQSWHDALKTYEVDAKQAAADKVAYEEYLKSIGVEPSFALAGRGETKPPEKAPVIDTKQFEKYVEKEQVAQAAQALARMPFEIQAINNQHFNLFGKTLSQQGLEALQTKFLDGTNKKSLGQLAAEEFHFAEREKELVEKDLQERTDKIVQEKLEKILSERQLPLSAMNVDPNYPKFGEDFAREVKRAGENEIGNVSDRDMQAFLTADAELAAAGIRPS